MSYSQEIFDALKAKIIEAFENVDYPKGFIIEHECEECFGVRKTFLNKDRIQVTSEILLDNYDKLPLFSPEAFHYFYPAYLIYSLEHFTEDEVSDFVVYGLIVNDKEIVEKTEYLEQRFQHFTKTQLNLVFEFMGLVVQSGAYKFDISGVNNGRQALLKLVELKLP